MNASVLAGLAGLSLIAFLAGALVVRPPLAPLARSLYLCLLCCALWTMGEMLASEADTLGAKRIGLTVMYSGSIFLPAVWVVTVLRWVRLHAPGVRAAPCPWERVPVAVAAAFWVLMVTDPWHGQFIQPVIRARNVYGPGVWALFAVGYAQMAVSVALCVYLARVHEAREVRRASLLLAVAACVPLAAQIFYVASSTYTSSRYTGLSLGFTSLATAFAIWWGRALWVMPVAFAEILRRDQGGVVLLDRRHAPVYWNDAASRLLSDPPFRSDANALDALADRLWDLEAGGHRTDGAALLADLDRAGGAGRIYRDDRGHDAWLRVTALDIGGLGVAAPRVLRIEDATRAIREARSREAVARRLVEAEKLKSLTRLAGEIAHGFNNRLAVILGNVEFAQDEVSPGSPLASLLGEVQEAAESAAGLTRQLLAVAGRAPAVVERVALGRLVQRVTAALAEQEQGTLALESAAAEGPWIEADPRQLEQALLALARSLRRRMGSAPGRLAIEAGADDRGPWLSLTDSAAPLTAEERARWQNGGDLDSVGLHDDDQGGLELAAGLALLRSNGGRLEGTLEPGGNRIAIRFRPAEVSAGPEPRPVSGVEPAVEPTGLGGGLVLVADDDPMVRRVAQGMLERLGFRVITAADGREAVAQVAASRDALRLVVLDLVMPELGGADALPAIRAQAPQLPVLLASGYVPDGPEAAAVDKADAFLAKPYRIETLRSVVRRLLA